MSWPVDNEHLAHAESLIDLCLSCPELLHKPEVSFLKAFIEHFGGKVPEESPKSSRAKSKPEEKVEEPEAELESEDSDLDLDMTGVIEPDNDPPQKMGNPTLQPTEEEVAESQTKRSEAVAAFIEKNYQKAMELYTEAIVLNPQAALLYAKRGQVYLFLNKPNACIRDCNRALELNPDSAAAHKFRGRAYQLLGNWEEAATDLRLACKFDFDEQADEWLREVTPNARKIEEHKRKKERKALDKLEKERQERLRKAKEAAKDQKENTTRPSQTDATGAGNSNFYQFLNDPEILQAFQDPEVAEAFKDISSNPSTILKYQSNPKVMALINKVASKFGGMGGMAGMGGIGGMGGMGGLGGMGAGFPGMMGGMPGAAAFASAAADAQNPPKPSGPSDDVGLD